MAKVSIGVPVYNGAELLAESLESLRAQTFADIEVIVSDNASTDDSRAIAEDFARRDPRFRVIPQAENIGAVGNFIATLEAASAPLFLWRAHDDLSDANYVEALQGLHDAYPEAVLAVGRVRSADLDGTKQRLADFPSLTGRAPALDRVRLLFGAHPSWVYGMWRTAYLREAFGRIVAAYPHPWAQDHLLLFAATLDGGIVGTGETAFRQRIRRTQADRKRRRPPLVTPQFRSAQRRDFAAACRAEMARAKELSALDRLAINAMLPFYVDKRVHSVSKVIKGHLRQALGGVKAG